MNKPLTDALGRATFHHIAPLRGVQPTERELRWFKHIERHGPQSSGFLYECTQDTHRCRDTALRDLKKLRAAGFLRLPLQQRATERAEFNPYIYDLTKQARDYLAGLGQNEDTLCPTGHWWHAYTIAAFTGSLDIYAARQGREYIPSHLVLARAGVDLPLPIGGQLLIPDQLFVIRYPDGYRAFLLEIDRGTEPLRSKQARKSLVQSVDLYTTLFKTGAHQRHYGLKCTTLVLYVFAHPGRRANFQDALRERAGPHTGQFLTKTLPSKLSFESLMTMHAEPWMSGTDKNVVGL